MAQTGLTITFLICSVFIALSSAQLSCYSCSGTYYHDGDNSDPNNCLVVSSTNTGKTTSCSGKCMTRVTLNDGSVTIQRGCETTVTDCNECTDPEDCRLCCDGSNDCNSDNLVTTLDNKMLTQTCYKCRYSEVLGVHSDAGCGLSFDETSSEITTVRCPGMCYSATSYIPGVEDIYRGCAYFGKGCDIEKYDRADQQVIRNSVTFQTRCCKGDKCNGVGTISASAIIVGVASILIFAPFHN